MVRKGPVSGCWSSNSRFTFANRLLKPRPKRVITNKKRAPLSRRPLSQWTAWVGGYYHGRIHSATKQSPRERAESGLPETIRRQRFAELTDLFLWEETRTADKTACVSLQGGRYEMDVALARRRVTLRYDPFDMTVVQVHSGPGAPLCARSGVVTGGVEDPPSQVPARPLRRTAGR